MFLSRKNWDDFSFVFSHVDWRVSWAIRDSKYYTGKNWNDKI